MSTTRAVFFAVLPALSLAVATTFTVIRVLRLRYARLLELNLMRPTLERELFIFQVLRPKVTVRRRFDFALRLFLLLLLETLDIWSLVETVQLAPH